MTRVAVVGAGYFGRFHYDAWRRPDGDARITVRAHGSNDWREHAYDWRDHLFGGDCVYLTICSALAAFRDGRPAETEAAACLRNLEIEDAVYRSHAERRWIDV